MSRFVILWHEMPDGADKPSHFDFMVEVRGVLRTWSLPQVPEIGEPLPADQLADHRLAYLDYEGEVSGGRGTVRRWDGGTCELVSTGENRLQLQVRGERVVGRVVLSREEPASQRWLLVVTD